MTINNLKERIESKSIGAEGIIFKAPDVFVPNQYIREIASIHSRDVKYVDSINGVKKSYNMFGKIDDGTARVFVTDRVSEYVELDDFCYIVCKNCENNSFVSVPKIEDWHALDYAITNSSEQIDRKYLLELVEACNSDMHLLDNEISKYNIFNENDQASVLKSLRKGNQIVASYNETIFDFVNAILDKNLSTIVDIYSNLDKYDIEAMAVVATIRKNLKNIILVGFNKNPTEASTGLSSKQIYWIKKNMGKYSAQRLIDDFIFICSVEDLLKNGILSSDQLLDYMLVRLL